MPGLLANDDIASSSEHQALESFLSGHSQDIERASDEFCKATESQAKISQESEEVEALLWRAWQATTALAAKTPYDSDDRQRLAEVIVGIQKRPDVQHDGKVCKVWDAVLWRDLPVLGAQLREAWNYTASDSSSKEEQSAWLNLNAFIATLASSSKNAELSLFGLWTIRTALEEQAEKPDSVTTSAAALWLTNASALLQDLSRQEKTFDGKVAKPGPRCGGESWRGFTEDRWQMWKARLSEVRGQAVSADAGKLVKRAVDAIESV